MIERRLDDGVVAVVVVAVEVAAAEVQLGKVPQAAPP